MQSRSLVTIYHIYQIIHWSVTRNKDINVFKNPQRFISLVSGDILLATWHFVFPRKGNCVLLGVILIPGCCLDLSSLLFHFRKLSKLRFVCFYTMCCNGLSKWSVCSNWRLYPMTYWGGWGVASLFFPSLTSLKEWVSEPINCILCFWV